MERRHQCDANVLPKTEEKCRHSIRDVAQRTNTGATRTSYSPRSSRHKKLYSDVPCRSFRQGDHLPGAHHIAPISLLEPPQTLVGGIGHPSTLERKTTEKGNNFLEKARFNVQQPRLEKLERSLAGVKTEDVDHMLLLQAAA